jgi:hypothetical protein
MTYSRQYINPPLGPNCNSSITSSKVIKSRISKIENNFNKISINRSLIIKKITNQLKGYSQIFQLPDQGSLNVLNDQYSDNDLSL